MNHTNSVSKHVLVDSLPAQWIAQFWRQGFIAAAAAAFFLPDVISTRWGLKLMCVHVFVSLSCSPSGPWVRGVPGASWPPWTRPGWWEAGLRGGPSLSCWPRGTGSCPLKWSSVLVHNGHGWEMHVAEFYVAPFGTTGLRCKTHVNRCVCVCVLVQHLQWKNIWISSGLSTRHSVVEALSCNTLWFTNNFWLLFIRMIYFIFYLKYTIWASGIQWLVFFTISTIGKAFTDCFPKPHLRTCPRTLICTP